MYILIIPCKYFVCWTKIYILLPVYLFSIIVGTPEICTLSHIRSHYVGPNRE